MKIRNITENISSQQRSAGQLPADFRPADTSPQLNGPYAGRNATRGYLVGESSDMSREELEQEIERLRQRIREVGEQIAPGNHPQAIDARRRAVKPIVRKKRELEARLAALSEDVQALDEQRAAQNTLKEFQDDDDSGGGDDKGFPGRGSWKLNTGHYDTALDFFSLFGPDEYQDRWIKDPKTGAVAWEGWSRDQGDTDALGRSIPGELRKMAGFRWDNADESPEDDAPGTGWYYSWSPDWKDIYRQGRDPKGGVREGHADQQRKIFRRNGQPVGEVGIDRESSPGVGQYYMKHYASGTDNSGYDSFEDALGDLRHVMKQSIYGELREQGVAKGLKSPVCKHCGKRQGEHRRGECPKGTKTAVGYTDYGPTKFEPKQQGVAEGKDISDMEMHKLNVKRFRKDLGLPDRDQPKRDRETDMDIHRYNAERFRRDLGLDKKPGVAEGTDFFDRFGLPIMPDDDGKFRDMMRGIKQGTKKQAAADRRARDAASRERARAAFGPSPADKLSIRRDQGVAEGVDIVDQDSDLDQQVFTLNVDGKTVSFTYWDYENNFQSPDIKDIYQQAREQLGKKLSPEQIKAVARSVFKSFKQGVAEGIMDTLKGAAREFTRDSLQKKIKQAWENTFWPKHIEPALNQIQINGQPFRRMVLGEPRVIENDRSKNAILKQYTVNIVFPIDPEQWAGDEIRYLEGQLRDIEAGDWNPKVHGLGLVSFDQPMKSFQYTKGRVPDLVIPVRITSLDINRSLVGEQGVAEGRFDEPLTGWHIVYRKSGNPVHATPSFETKDQAQKYLMTKMFANHQDYKVVHTAGVGVSESGYNPLDDERREQSRMDAERRQFRRDELAAELGGEEQRAQQIMSGTWYIVIDGQVWRRQGEPVTFSGREAARRAGQTIKNRTPERTVTITTKLPTQRIAELTDMGTAVAAQPTVTPTANNDQQVEVIFFGVPGKDYWARDAWDALEEVLPNEYPRGSERAQLKIAEVQKHGGAVVTVKPLAQAKKLVDTFRGYGIKARINASGINESVIEQERLRIFRESVAAGMTSEDVITTMKRQLGDYLQDVATAIRKDPDLVNKIPKTGDQIGPAVRTIKTDDGHEIRIHGNEDDGFRISIRNRTIPSRFKSLDEAEIATEMYCARRRQATQLRDDYVDEA